MRPWYIAHRLWKGIRDPEDMKKKSESVLEVEGQFA